MDILRLSLWASPLITFIVILRALFIHRLPKITFPVLWALALARLLLPFSIPSPLSLGNIMAAGGAALPQALSPLMDEIPAVVTPNLEPNLTPIAGIPAAAQTAAPDLPLLLLLWLAGFAACALFFLLTHGRTRRVYQTTMVVENTLVENWQAAHPLRRAVRIRQSDELDSPLTYGIWRPVILLPKNLDWQDENKLNYILAHEYVHIRRLDALAKWLLALVLSVHWFNPLVWLMYILANRDLELSCDEAVLRIFGEGKKSAYALTLLNLEEQRNNLTPLCNHFTKNAIEERIVAIMRIKKFTRISVVASCVLVVCVAMVFATSSAPAAAILPSADQADSPAIAPAFTLSFAPSAPAATGMPVNTLVRAEGPARIDYMARMLFFSKGEAVLKVTYDGITWATSSFLPGDESWYWWGFEEYKAYVEYSIKQHFANHSVTQEELDEKMARYVQTLEDIRNGIKVSKLKQVFVLDPGPQFGTVGGLEGRIIYDGIISWGCFGYSVTEASGNEVDLGLFETRDQLFAALRQYYDGTVATGTLTQAEADNLYAGIAHSVRNTDEVPLEEKMLNYEKYANTDLMWY